MRVLEALTILEDATVECMLRNVDTPEVTEALDLLYPYCRPTWFIEGFRNHLRPCKGQFGPEFEGQQQNLRVNFRGIHANVRHMLISRIGRLGARCCKTKDSAVRA